MECKLTAIDVHASPGSSIRTLVLLAPSSSFPFRVRGAARMPPREAGCGARPAALQRFSRRPARACTRTRACTRHHGARLTRTRVWRGQIQLQWPLGGQALSPHNDKSVTITRGLLSLVGWVRINPKHGSMLPRGDGSQVSAHVLIRAHLPHQAAQSCPVSSLLAELLCADYARAVGCRGGVCAAPRADALVGAHATAASIIVHGEQLRQ